MHDRVAVARAGSVWPFVGREEELASIADARADGCSGVVLCADAGIGKSRLGREALVSAEREGAMTEWVQATRSAGLIPLGAWAGLLPDEVPSDQAFRLLQATVQALHERASGRPIVVGVDDAQWLDPVSATLVLQLASGGDAFVIATVRVGEPCPDAVISLWKDAGARRFELGGLGDDEIRGLIETVLEGPVEERVMRWILDRSGGNPMYARELVNGAVSGGSLAWVGGLWRLSGPLSIAESLVEFVEQRMAELPAEQQAPLEFLALAEPLRLHELAGLTSYDALAEVEAAGLIVVAPGSNDVRLAHPLYGEALRASLPALRARGLRVRLAADAPATRAADARGHRPGCADAPRRPCANSARTSRQRGGRGQLRRRSGPRDRACRDRGRRWRRLARRRWRWGGPSRRVACSSAPRRHWRPSRRRRRAIG